MKHARRFLQHAFIPHKENAYLPRFFHEHFLLTLFIASSLLLLISFTSYTILHTTTFGAKVVDRIIVSLTNEMRIQNNLPPLSYNQRLQDAATLKCRDMRENHYFSHFSPEGVTPWYFFKQVGYRFLFAGENLAINFNDSSSVVSAWMQSKEHRANILNPRFQDIGVATLQGKERGIPFVFVVELFGTESSAKEHIAESFREPSWYEWLLFNTPRYIEKVYYVLTLTTFIALLLMIGIEIRVQHKRHILYGVLLLIVLLICMYSNALFM